MNVILLKIISKEKKKINTILSGYFTFFILECKSDVNMKTMLDANLCGE